jgi:hypothetical protein
MKKKIKIDDTKFLAEDILSGDYKLYQMVDGYFTIINGELKVNLSYTNYFHFEFEKWMRLVNEANSRDNKIEILKRAIHFCITDFIDINNLILFPYASDMREKLEAELNKINRTNNIIEENVLDIININVPEPFQNWVEEIFSALSNLSNDTRFKENILITKNRIINADIKIDGFTKSEISNYQLQFAKEFITLLHTENFIIHIEDKIKVLLFYCKGLEQDLRTKQYEYLEDREYDKSQHTEAERYKIYLENLLIHLAEPQQPETKNGSKPTITAYAIMHVYLAMFKGQAVTQQNKKELVKKYGYNSGDQLRNDFTLYQNDEKRLDLNTTNKRAADTHLKRFKDILPLLENLNKSAFEKAIQDYNELQKTYNKHH